MIVHKCDSVPWPNRNEGIIEDPSEVIGCTRLASSMKVVVKRYIKKRCLLLYFSFTEKLSSISVAPVLETLG